MTSMRARYQAGSWVSISVPRRWLLVDIEPQQPSVQQLWDAISSGDTAEAVLDILISEGIRATPSFVLLWFEERPRAFINGSGALDVTVAADTVTYSADRLSLWAEVEVEVTASQFCLLGAGPVGDLELPMASGVTVAGRIVVTTTAPVPAAPATAPTELAPTPAAATIKPMPAAEAATVPMGSRTPGPAPVEPADVRPGPEGDEPDSGPVPTETAPLPPALTPPMVATMPGAGRAPVDEASYDYLFGATMRPAAARELRGVEAGTSEHTLDERPGPADFGMTAGWHTVAPTNQGPAAPEPKPSSGLIDAVPWLAGPSSPARAPTERIGAEETPASSPSYQVPQSPQPVVGARPNTNAAADANARPSANVRPSASVGPDATPDELDDVEGTVNRSALLASTAPAMSGPSVLALRCPAGHLTPAHSAVCRVCQVSIAEQQPFEIARPALGLLRLSTGDSVILDRGVLIGRNPATPPASTERPHLVRVNSPDHDVSRQHAEVVLEGWHVYVRDLGSTNGTTVTLPGQPPQRLRDSELQLLEHSAVIVLADEIQCVFEVMP